VTTALIGPFYQAGPLAPQQEHVWAIGPFSAGFSGTMHVMAHPYIGQGVHYTQAAAVTSLSTAVDPVGQHAVNFIVRNTFTTTIAAYTVWLTTIEG